MRRSIDGADDLFTAAVAERLERRSPLAARLRPRSLDEVVGQQHLLGPGRPLRVLIEADRLSSVVLWGPPGTGKTTIARLVAGATSKAFEPLSAVTAGVKDVREVGRTGPGPARRAGKGTILFLDEVHRFSRTQQDALLPHVEEGLFVLIGATTENPFFSLTGPLLSRSTLFRLEPLTADDLRELLRARAHRRDARPRRGAPRDRRRRARPTSSTGPRATPATRSRRSRSPPRWRPSRAAPRSRSPTAEAALALRALRYGDDEHYDVLSAFIKSIRGSDVDAGLYWLARMVDGGGGPAPHRPPPGDPRVGRRRDGRSAGSRGRRRRRARGRVRGHARGAAQPRPRRRRTWPARPSRTRSRPRSAPPCRTCATARPARSPTTCGTPITLARRSSGTARGTCIRTTSPRAGWPSSTGPTRSRSGVLGAHRPRAPTSTAEAIRRTVETGAGVSGSEWARGAGGAQACLVALVVLVVVIVRLDRAAKDLRAAAADFRAEAEPALDGAARRSCAPPTSSSTASTRSSPAPSASAAASTPPPTSRTAPSPARWSRRSRSAPAPSGRAVATPARASGDPVRARRARSDGRPDVQARHLARCRASARRGHDRRRRAQGQAADGPLQARGGRRPHHGQRGRRQTRLATSRGRGRRRQGRGARTRGGAARPRQPPRTATRPRRGSAGTARGPASTL